MNFGEIESAVEIHVPADRVWKVFTDPALTRKMGGEYVTDWKPGSTFGWKSNDGKMLTHGMILKIDSEKLLMHNLFSSAEAVAVTSEITYQLEERDGHTWLYAREKMSGPLSEAEYRDAVQGWSAALQEVKKIAEDI